MRTGIESFRRALVGAALAACVATATAQVQHGRLNVVENDNGNLPTSVTVTRVGGAGPWITISDDGLDSSNRGDYTVDFLTGNDQNLGILMVGPMNDNRTEPNVGPSPYYATISHSRTASGTNRYYAAVHSSPGGAEVNYNAALGYFPLADGWLAGGFYNSTNGGPIDLFVAPSYIVLTNPFDPNVNVYPSALVDNASGFFNLRVEGIDMNRDGVLLVCGGKNEDNMAMAYIDALGRARINIKDNGSDGNTGEQDPGAFVFIPEGTPGVTMGRITGTGRKLFHQGNFEVVMVDQPTTNGTWRLTIAGESPTTGTLIVSPYNEGSGNTIDNPVFVVPDGDGWKITSRDIAGMGLQDVGSSIAFHFAFFKDGVNITPGTPSKSYLDRIADVVSARFVVQEFSPNNTDGDMRADKSIGSTALNVFSDNRGDVGITWLNSRPASYVDNSLDAFEGVWLGNVTEFLRDNVVSGGVSGWGTLSFDNGEARTHVANDVGAEINCNFALAFFPVGFGFQQNADVQVLTGTQDIVTITGDATNDGVCLAINWDNNNRVVSARPLGSTYVIECWEGTTGLPSADWDYGYVYIPYTTPGIIAGQVSASGQIISGTGGFSVGTATDTLGFPVTTITIPGVNPATDGVLVVTPTDGPDAMNWEVGPGYFEVAGLDLTNFLPGQAAFAFAYVPFDLSPPAPTVCPGDVNCDGSVNFSDIDLFVEALSYPGGTGWPYAECPWLSADANGDNDVTFADIDSFVALIGTTCP